MGKTVGKRRIRWGGKHIRRGVAGFLAGIVLGMSAFPCFPVQMLESWAFHLNFESSGDPSHPNLFGKAEGESRKTAFFCLNKGAKARSAYDYYKTDEEVSYHQGSLEDKRLFWAYIGTYGSCDGDASLKEKFGMPLQERAEMGKEVAWSKGADNGGSEWVERQANDGFMALESVPESCKSPEDIFQMVSGHRTEATAMYLGDLRGSAGPGTIDGDKLYELCGLADWNAFKKYCTLEAVTPGCVVNLEDKSFAWTFPGAAVGESLREAVFKVTYDPAVFCVLEVTGSLEYYRCSEEGSQQLYRAKGKVREAVPEFYLTTKWQPSDETAPGGGEISVTVYDHSETFESNYKVDLKKYDYETGFPLNGSVWQVLEKFDAGQLDTDETALAGGDTSGLLEENMREDPTTWKEWLVFEDDLTTDRNGYISHEDRRYYDFSHRYCDGHPIPPEPETDEEDEDSDAQEEYEELMERWQQAVDDCAGLEEESGGSFHHWECGSEETPSVEEAFEQSGCREARDQAYEHFINLEYSYTFRETDARDGYILHSPAGHPDDVPVEIITAASSESGKQAVWTECSNDKITVSGYRRNERADNKVERIRTSAAKDGVALDGQSAATPADLPGEQVRLRFSDEEHTGLGERLIDLFRGFFGLPDKVLEENDLLVKVRAKDYETATVSDTAELEEDEAGTMDLDQALVNDIDLDKNDRTEGRRTRENKNKDTDQTAETGENEAAAATASNCLHKTNSGGENAAALVIRTENEKATGADAVYAGVGRNGFWPDLKKRDSYGEVRENQVDPDNACEDGMPSVQKGAPGRLAHTFLVYDHRVPGEIHFNKRDMELAAGETAGYDSYGDSQGDATLEGAVYGLFAAESICGPDAQRDRSGSVVSGTGVIFDANDLVAVASTDRNGDGSFPVITEIPHSVYDYRAGQIRYTGKEYPSNLYMRDGWVKDNENQETGRLYQNNQERNGCCWIGRPLILGNYYIKELTRSEGYELSITGKDMEVSNQNGVKTGLYGETSDAISQPAGKAWITKRLDYAVTFPGENEAYGNRSSLLTLETASQNAVHGYNLVFDGLPEDADFYYNGVTLSPVTVRTPVGGEWIDAKEEPLYRTAQGDNVWKRTRDGQMIEDPEARKTIPCSYTGIGRRLKELEGELTAGPELSGRYEAAFDGSEDNFQYVKYELEQMMRSLGMETPKDGEGNYSQISSPVYDGKAGNDGSSGSDGGNAEYGMPEMVLEISNVTTNRSVIEAILDYYTKERVFTYGGLQNLRYDGSALKAVVVAGMTPARELLYQTDDAGEILAVYLARLNKNYGRYVIRKYTGDEFSAERIGSGSCRVKVTPDYQVNDAGVPEKLMMYPSDREHYLHYNPGDILYDYWYQDRDGDWVGHEPVRRKEYHVLFKEEETMGETINTSQVVRLESAGEAVDPEGSTFVVYDAGAGQYTLHVGTAAAAGADGGTDSFTVALKDQKTAVSQEDIRRVGTENVWGYREGDVLDISEYVIRISGAGAGAFTAENFDTSRTFIENQQLICRGNHDLYEDGGTRENPRHVKERVIGQKIKITKEIEMAADGFYAQDTYGGVHPDNLSRDLWGRWLKKTPDWLSGIQGSTASGIPGFRFKLYLKSNLERLYREEDGTVVWQDRNGNVTADPAARKKTYPQEVMKLYTKVLHTPEVEKDSRNAVIANSQLYSFYGGLIQDVPNPGYTSVLEVAAADQTGEPRYNYAKFFDALRTANTDRWKNLKSAGREFTDWESWDAVRNIWEGKIDGSVSDTSYKPFAEILSGKFGVDEAAQSSNPPIHNNPAVKNESSTSPEAKKNANSSDAVRQFAITWYLEEEVRKLVRSNEAGETEAKEGAEQYSEEVYDKALYAAIQKADHYLTPFFRYDLDALYSIAWDGEPGGGEDRDEATLSADTPQTVGKGYFGISRSLPYGIYVAAEQQPAGHQPGQYDFYNRHFKIDQPKEIILPAQVSSKYQYQSAESSETMAVKYNIRFQEECPDKKEEGGKRHVIYAHNAAGDFEVYPYGLDVDKLTGIWSGGEYGSEYDGFQVTQDTCDPIKDYYNDPLVDTKEEGGNPNSHYFADDRDYPKGDPAIHRYPVNEIEKMYHYGSVSEHAELVNGVRTMTGELTARQGEYAPMLVPWSMKDPEEKQDTEEDSFCGYAEKNFRNSFYSVKLRIEKLDDETGESILHDQAVFALYAASRDDEKTGEGAVKFYDRPTVISGSREFVKAMGASDMHTLVRDIADPAAAASAAWYGTVPAGTPVCLETERIILSDEAGQKTGDFRAFTTQWDGEMAAEPEMSENRITAGQNTGYLELPEPLGAGVYVLAEISPPAGLLRSKPAAVEIYSDQVSYYQDGDRDKRTAAAVYEDTARIYVGNTPVRLEVSKKKTDADTVTYRVSGRAEGSITELEGRYGLENLELAYNASGTYLGYGWRKGMAELLAARQEAGEQVEMLYEQGVFSGCADITCPLQTAGDANRYVPGATLTLYDAIAIKRNGDGEDIGYDGVEVLRDRNGNVSRMYVRQGYAGEKTEFVPEREDGREGWTTRTVWRPDTDILFYDLGRLSVLSKDRNGQLWSYDSSGLPIRIVDGMTGSIYALQNGRAVFEIVSGDYSALKYDSLAKAFTQIGADTVVYHLDQDGVRDAMVNPYTGMAYVTDPAAGVSGAREETILVWPVNLVRDRYNHIIAVNKIKTSRIASIHADTEQEYTTGTYISAAGGRFEKRMNPLLDGHGLVQYYQRSEESYKKSSPVDDRDGDFMYDRYDDGLAAFNKDAYIIKETDRVFDKGVLWDKSDNREDKLYMRQGDSYILENTWVSGDQTPNDPFDVTGTLGQADMLKRVIPGSYIMEEVTPPDGYAKSFPVAVTVGEDTVHQSVTMYDEKTKTVVIKADMPESFQIKGLDYDRFVSEDGELERTEGKGAYSYQLVAGAKLALYRAKKVYTADSEQYPSGWHVEKTEDHPFIYLTCDGENQPSRVSAMWTTKEHPLWLEGIPSGVYLLEESDAPSGYIRTSVPVEIRKTGEVQTIFAADDHTKLEIYKYQMKDGKKQVLSNDHAAGLALYPAVTDGKGQVVMADGTPLYQAERPLDAWMTDDCSEYTGLTDLSAYEKWGVWQKIKSALGFGEERVSGFQHDYESMYEQYGAEFDELHWYYTDVPYDGKGELPVLREGTACLEESWEADRSDCMHQIWRTGDGRKIRISVSPERSRAGDQTNTFEYQYHYQKLEGNAVSYDTADGCHRIDYVPWDHDGEEEAPYVLVETKTPEGYQQARPKLILVRETASVQMYAMENRPVPEIPRETVPEETTLEETTPEETVPETTGPKETSPEETSTVPETTTVSPTQPQESSEKPPRHPSGDEDHPVIPTTMQEETTKEEMILGRITADYSGKNRAVRGVKTWLAHRLAQMGDPSLRWIWILLSVVSGIGIIIGVRRKEYDRKKHGQKKPNHPDHSVDGSGSDSDGSGGMPGD